MALVEFTVSQVISCLFMTSSQIFHFLDLNSVTPLRMNTFKELSISENILKAIADQGYESPTPIQAQTLPILLGDRTDFLGLAATGTGKTAAFSIPMLEKIELRSREVQALVLCPTRELAVQVTEQINHLAKHTGARATAIYGGAGYIEQLNTLRRGVAIVVGTPGRIVDHLERGTLKLDNLKVMILDEADEMISMGFAEDMELILGKTPRATCNTWLFSATMNPQVSRLTKKYLVNPKEVRINKTEILSGTVEQLFYIVRESDKPEILCKLIDAADAFYGIIFCQTKMGVTQLAALLAEKGYKVDSLHGDKDQKSREHTLRAFRDRKVQILVCTDVAARGIDVKDITHVVNYSVPFEMDSYVHRIGRTARSGKTGIAMNLVSPSQKRLISNIERFTKSQMTPGQIPTRREIGLKKINALLPKFQAQPNATRAQEILNREWKQKLAEMSSEQVAAHFLALMMPDLFTERERSNDHARYEDIDSRRRQDQPPRHESRPRRERFRAEARGPRTRRDEEPRRPRSGYGRNAERH